MGRTDNRRRYHGQGLPAALQAQWARARGRLDLSRRRKSQGRSGNGGGNGLSVATIHCPEERGAGSYFCFEDEPQSRNCFIGCFATFSITRIRCFARIPATDVIARKIKRFSAGNYEFRKGWR